MSHNSNKKHIYREREGAALKKQKGRPRSNGPDHRVELRLTSELWEDLQTEREELQKESDALAEKTGSKRKRVMTTKIIYRIIGEHFRREKTENGEG